MVLVSAQFFVTKYIGLRFPFVLFFKNIIANIPMLFFLIPIYFYVDNIVLSFVFGGLMGKFSIEVQKSEGVSGLIIYT